MRGIGVRDRHASEREATLGLKELASLAASFELFSWQGRREEKAMAHFVCEDMHVDVQRELAGTGRMRSQGRLI